MTTLATNNHKIVAPPEDVGAASLNSKRPCVKRLLTKTLLCLFTAILAVSTSACGGWWGKPSSVPAIPPPIEIETGEANNMVAIRYLEDKIKANPDDFVAFNKLAGHYLQMLRETGSAQYLDLARRAANSSLEIIPAERNRGGLYWLAQVEFASHSFQSALDHAERLARESPGKSEPYSLICDSLIELGEYDRAVTALKKLTQLEGSTLASETRAARLALLRGQTDVAFDCLSKAVSLAQNEFNPNRETVAWCRWQLGEVAFSIGDYEAAERHYRDLLITFPDYYRALGSLARAMAARGDVEGAIELYERATRIVPDPAFIAALGDLYKTVGRDKDADAQYSLVEKIAMLGSAEGQLYTRQMAVYYADHDLKPDDAYLIASKEYESRRDIYGADVVAWTALKSGRISEAQSAIKQAMKLGTKDARILYHAGMIYHAAGDNASARNYIELALKLNPQFDPIQSVAARKALAEL